MTNDNQAKIDSLKASFCRQHFPDLLQFLRIFDISQNEGKAANDTLNMNFLLQAYVNREEKVPKKKLNEKDEVYLSRIDEEHEKHIQSIAEAKKNCKWHIENVEEAEVFSAVYEYFEILSSRKDIYDATTILLKNINTGKKAKVLFPIDNSEKEIYTFEDKTTSSILKYFGIKIDNETLGKQRDLFAQFVLKSSSKQFKKDNSKENVVASDKVFPQSVYDSIPEAQFIQAFQLLVDVRNWSEHNHIFLQKSNYAYRLYRFIIFTHIGLTYICRRLWSNKQTSQRLQAGGYKKPNDYEIGPEVLIIKIIGNNKDDIISDCCWAADEGEYIHIEKEAQREIEFPIMIRRYQTFKIKFNHNEKPYSEIIEKLNYYVCNSDLCILVKPPHADSFELRDIAGEDEEVEKYLSSIFSKSIKGYWSDHNEKCDEALKQLAKLEPYIIEQQNLIGKIDNDSEERKKDIHEIIIPQLKVIDEGLNDIKAGINKTYELLKNNSRGFGIIIVVVCTVLFLHWIYNNLFTLLQFPTILSLISSLAILVFCISLYFIIKLRTPFKFLQEKTSEAKLSFYFKTIVILAALVGFLEGGIKVGRDIYLNRYDFADNDTEKNQKAVKLMESVLATNPKDDEGLRIQLTKYYLDYADDKQKALLVASPMLDNIDKYKKGILLLAEVLYSQGKDFWKVRDILEIYRKSKEKDQIVINRIQGIMDIWGQGQTSNLSEGINSLLKNSADNGDVEAQYYLGYVFSHEMTDWEKSKLTGIVEFSECNLVDAVDYLRKAAFSKPKAALELGKLYSDLNVTDSAEVYLNKVRRNSCGDLYKESLYRLGLLYEGTDSGRQYMTDAAFLDYEPAILYKANKEKDHKAAIELYSRPKGYQGYRYILPVVFDYIALGQSKKALKVLQEERPYGNFDMNFINGMEMLLGTSQIKRDSIAGMNYMKMSAEKGCLYAEMICLFKEASLSRLTDYQEHRMIEIGEEIPFAFVLLSYLAHKEERMMPQGLPYSDYFANRAIVKGCFAGRLMLVVPPYYEKFINQTISDTTYYAKYHFNFRQRAFRENRDKRWNILYAYKAEKNLEGGKDSLSYKSKQFWNVVSKANNVDLNEVNHQPYNLHELTDWELLNEFSDSIIDNQQDNPFIF